MARFNKLKLLAANLNIENRVYFISSMDNDALCKILSDFDIFVTHSEFWEISKSVLEPLLVGLPVIINSRIGKPVPEFNSNFIVTVSNTVEGYTSALEKIIQNNQYRKNLGISAYKYSQEKWAPSVTENVFINIYKKIMLR